MEGCMKNGLDHILEKSSKLIAARGYHGTSMRSLAKATDRSLAGLYHYFNNKEEVLYLINHNGFSYLLTAAQTTDKEDNLSAENKLRSFISNHVFYFSNHIDEMKVMMSGTQPLDQKRGGAIRKLKNEYTEVAQNIVKGFVASKGRHKLAKTELERKTFLLFGMMNWIFGWYSRQEHGATEELTQDIFKTFTRGILQ